MISIAMATYNGEKYLEDQLRSIYNQTFQDWELIVCDDHSSDRTLDILTAAAQFDSRIHIFKNEQNLGFLKNFEKILSLCNGEFIACCDQDDIWNPNHLKNLIEQISHNDCIGANGLIVDSNGKSTGTTVKDSLSVENLPTDSQSLFKHECFYNLIQGTASLFRANLLTSILPFPEGIKFHDHWIALNASLQNGCLYHDKIVLDYRNHNQNVTGYKKFNLLKALKTAFNSRKIRATMYAPNLEMLRALKLRKISRENIAYINEAIIFFENLSLNKNRFSSILFYIRNYNEIALCSKRKWKLFSYRIFCLAFFGIML